MSNTDETRRDDLGRDAASSTLGDGDTGLKPARLGDAPEPTGGKPTPMEQTADVANQSAAAESRRDVAAGVKGTG
ncbi:hypothetical protein ASG43_09890 [Aureimonas sp. Leaf454]|uniref:hypothetical protein n=1 Tax=Aureimonas sp. Leaf454 TaxID=1736381 RepID=UPI0006F29F80|nr:hypothetical protein [Aureimonas sp. Leaf454]KQT47422.1 hypothetical protein ASG43_09890 [Aureimonas sp. Leaf454]